MSEFLGHLKNYFIKLILIPMAFGLVVILFEVYSNYRVNSATRSYWNSECKENSQVLIESKTKIAGICKDKWSYFFFDEKSTRNVNVDMSYEFKESNIFESIFPNVYYYAKDSDYLTDEEHKSFYVSAVLFGKSKLDYLNYKNQIVNLIDHFRKTHDSITMKLYLSDQSDYNTNIFYKAFSLWANDFTGGYFINSEEINNNLKIIKTKMFVSYYAKIDINKSSGEIFDEAYEYTDYAAANEYFSTNKIPE